MEKQAKIKIVGTQKAEYEEPQRMEFITNGKLQRFGNKLCVSYEESDLFGMDGVTSTFEVQEGRIALERTGKLRTRMEFVEGSRTESMYMMDVGTLLLGITARKVEENMTENGGTIHLEYGVEIDRRLLGRSTYDISVETLP